MAKNTTPKPTENQLALIVLEALKVAVGKLNLPKEKDEQRSE